MPAPPGIDPTVPVHRQPTLTVRPPGDCILHQWFTYANGIRYNEFIHQGRSASK